jgi:hypothetical protein
MPSPWVNVEHPPQKVPTDWINVQIMERFNAEGIDFVFPTQTLHIVGDDKRRSKMRRCTARRETTRFPRANRTNRPLQDELEPG